MYGRMEHADGNRFNSTEKIVLEGIERGYSQAIVAASRSATDDDMIAAHEAQQRAVQLAIEGRAGAAIRYHNHALAVLGVRRV